LSANHTVTKTRQTATPLKKIKFIVGAIVYVSVAGTVHVPWLTNRWFMLDFLAPLNNKDHVQMSSICITNCKIFLVRLITSLRCFVGMHK